MRILKYLREVFPESPGVIGLRLPNSMDGKGLEMGLYNIFHGILLLFQSRNISWSILSQKIIISNASKNTHIANSHT